MQIETHVFKWIFNLLKILSDGSVNTKFLKNLRFLVIFSWFRLSKVIAPFFCCYWAVIAILIKTTRGQSLPTFLTPRFSLCFPPPNRYIYAAWNKMQENNSVMEKKYRRQSVNWAVRSQKVRAKWRVKKGERPLKKESGLLFITTTHSWASFLGNHRFSLWYCYTYPFSVCMRSSV